MFLPIALLVILGPASDADETPPVVPSVRDALQPEIDKALSAAQKETFQELAIADTIKAHFKSSLWQKAVREPWGALAETERRGLALAAASRAGLAGLPKIVDRMGGFLDKQNIVPRDGTETPTTLDEHLKYLESVLDAAAVHREEAMAGLSATEREFLFVRSARLIHDFRPQATFNERNKPVLRDDLRFCTLWERRVEPAKFAASVRTLLTLSDPVHLDRLKTAMEKSPTHRVADQPGAQG